MEWRQILLAACRRHVRDHGRVLVQRHEPEWFLTDDRTWISARPTAAS